MNLFKRKIIFLKVSSRIDRLNDKAIHILISSTRGDFEINKNVSMFSKKKKTMVFMQCYEYNFINHDYYNLQFLFCGIYF